MRVFVTPKLSAYAALAALGCLAGLVLRRPEPVLLGAPFLVALVLGLAASRVPAVRAAAVLSSERAMENEVISLEITLESARPVARVEVALRLPEGLKRESGNPVRAVSLSPGEPRTLQQAIRCDRWGGYAVGELFVRTRDQFGFVVAEAHFDQRNPFRVYPRPAGVHSIVHPAETQVFAGNERSRAKGDGIEFIDVRPFAAGDRVRHINWRLSTRRGDLYVNEYHLEQNSDIVLFLDAFAETRRVENGMLNQAVRGAAALAERYLERRDRVGLVSFGGILRWLRPSMGLNQRYRLIEALIDTEVLVSVAWKGIEVIPAFVLPPKALVIAFTPLMDERSIDALLDLRARGFDLAIVETSPELFVQPPSGESARLAREIWRMEREALRHRFRRLAVPVVEWNADQPLEGVIQEVREFRRYARRARA